MSSLFPALTEALTEGLTLVSADDSAHGPVDRPALRFGDRSLTYAELAAVADALAHRLTGHSRVAVWATSELETAVAVVAALRAGVAAVPLNPKSGEKELGHILTDSEPALVLAAPGDELPAALRDLPRVDVGIDPGADAGVAAGGPLPDTDASDEDPALVVYTSGTTGPPKGAVIPAGRSPPPWTPWPTPGSGPAPTCWCTGCRCSTCTAWSWASSARCGAVDPCATSAGSPRKA